MTDNLGPEPTYADCEFGGIQWVSPVWADWHRRRADTAESAVVVTQLELAQARVLLQRVLQGENWVILGGDISAFLGSKS